MHLFRRLKIFKTIFYDAIYTEQCFGSMYLPFEWASNDHMKSESQS